MSTNTLYAGIKLRRDSAVDWTAANPVLLEGELGLETDTKKLKVGDGVTAWNSLGYELTKTAEEIDEDTYHSRSGEGVLFFTDVPADYPGGHNYNTLSRNAPSDNEALEIDRAYCNGDGVNLGTFAHVDQSDPDDVVQNSEGYIQPLLDNGPYHLILKEYDWVLESWWGRSHLDGSTCVGIVEVGILNVDGSREAPFATFTTDPITTLGPEKHELKVRKGDIILEPGQRLYARAGGKSSSTTVDFYVKFWHSGTGENASRIYTPLPARDLPGIIETTFSELKTLADTSSLLPFQQYSFKYHHKYFQAYTGTLKMGEHDNGSEPVGYYSDELVVTAISSSALDPIAISKKFPGHNVYYDITKTHVAPLAETWTDAQAWDGYGIIVKDGTQYYVHKSSYTNAGVNISDTDHWTPVFTEAQASREGFIYRRNNTVLGINVPFDFKNTVHALFKPDLTAITLHDGLSATVGDLVKDGLDNVYLCIKTNTDVDTSITGHFFKIYDVLDGYTFAWPFYTPTSDVLGVEKLIPLDTSDYIEVFPFGDGQTPLIDNSENSKNITMAADIVRNAAIEPIPIFHAGSTCRDVVIKSAVERCFSLGSFNRIETEEAKNILCLQSVQRTTIMGGNWGNVFAREEITNNIMGGLNNIMSMGVISYSLAAGYVSQSIFSGEGMTNNVIKGQFENNIYGSSCKNNEIDSVHMRNKFWDFFEGNKTGYYCADNDFEQAFKRINCGHDFRSNIGLGSNQFSDSVVGGNCQGNTFDGTTDNVRDCTFGEYVENNTFPSGFKDNVVGNRTNGVTFPVVTNTNFSKIGVYVVRDATAAGETLPLSDEFVEVAGTATYYLPNPLAYIPSGKFFIIKKNDAGTTTTINGNGVNIDQAATKDLTAQDECLKVVWNGTIWRII